MTTRPKLAILIRHPVIRADFLQQLSQLKTLECCVFESVSEFVSCAGKDFFSVVLDIRMILGASSREKQMLLDIECSLPVFRLQRDPDSGELRAMGENESTLRSSEIAAVFDQLAITRPRRGIRKNPRKQYHMSLLISIDNAPPIRTVTFNVSRGGLFLIYCDEIAPGSTLSAVFPTWKDRTPVPIGICWSVPWGGCSTQTPPGIGVRFLCLTPQQEADLNPIDQSPLYPE